MRIQVTGRHLTVSEDIRAYIEEKTERLAHHFARINHVEVILDGGKKHRYNVEVILTAPKGTILVSHDTEESLTAAVDIALEKIDRQLEKFKERLQRKGGARRGGALVAPESTEDEA